MNKIRAILVDDEESARDVLENLLLRFCPEVELLAKCENVLQAVDVIKEKQPQLVFLDIEMPNYAGYELVKFFGEINFEIVFVTAYNQYAVRAFEVAAVDYLLKPVDIDRLRTAVARVRQQVDVKGQMERMSLLSDTLETKAAKSIMVMEKGEQYVVVIDTIIAVEADDSYSVVYTTDKKYVVSKNLKHFESIFETMPRFFRVHKSWIVNLDHLQHYSKTDLEIKLSTGLSAKLSKYKKVEFEAALLK